MADSAPHQLAILDSEPAADGTEWVEVSCSCGARWFAQREHLDVTHQMHVDRVDDPTDPPAGPGA